MYVCKVDIIRDEAQLKCGTVVGSVTCTGLWHPVDSIHSCR